MPGGERVEHVVFVVRQFLQILFQFGDFLVGLRLVRRAGPAAVGDGLQMVDLGGQFGVELAEVFV